MNDLLKDVTVPAVVEAIEGNLAAFLLYCNRVQGATVHDDAELTFVLTGVESSFFNAVIRLRLPSDELHERVTNILAPFKARKTPMLW
jgi:hypothetical protein